MTKSAQYWKSTLGLLPHPEGGAFKETYRAAIEIPTDRGTRHASTAIYFLLEAGQFSAFHRIRSDEMWHFYDGVPLHIYEIQVDGNFILHKLGNAASQGCQFQVVIPAGSWFAAKVAEPGGYSFVGCTVSPGFDFQDFEMAERNRLQSQFPEHATLIASLTYEQKPS